MWRLDGSNSEIIFDGLDFTKGELIYILENEDVKSAEDLLRRRTPIMLVRTQQEIAKNKLISEVLAKLAS
jgi:glycerol-3-phosphate dehydrogenase